MCRLELIRKLNILVQLKRDTYLNRLRNHQDTVRLLYRQHLFILFILCGFFPVTVSN